MNNLLLVLSNDLMLVRTLPEAESLEPVDVFVMTVFDNDRLFVLVLSFVLTIFVVSSLVLSVFVVSTFVVPSLILSLFEFSTFAVDTNDTCEIQLTRTDDNFLSLRPEGYLNN